MCQNMKELQEVSEKIFELEQKKAKKKKEMEALEEAVKQLKNEAASYMKKRQKNELNVVGFTVVYKKFDRPYFSKDAFIAGEKNGAVLYKKYSKIVPIEQVTVKIAK